VNRLQDAGDGLLLVVARDNDRYSGGHIGIAGLDLLARDGDASQADPVEASRG
jgi:hypothetical protein